MTDAAIDYAFVTGEATPALVRRGERVHAGGRVTDRTLRLAAVREVSHSRLAGSGITRCSASRRPTGWPA